MLRRASGRVDGLIIETPHRRRPQRAPARQASTHPGRRAHLWRTRPGEHRRSARTWRAFLAGRRIRKPGKTRRSRLPRARPAYRSAQPLRSAKNPAFVPTSRSRLLAQAAAGTAEVFTDPLASPTGFPFKVAQLAGTSSAAEVYEERNRVCDLGFLREAYCPTRRPDRLSLFRRTASLLRCERRESRRDDWPQMPLQRLAGQHRPCADPQRRRHRACPGYGGRRPE